MKEKAEEWTRETARDTLALGSWAFCILVVARAAIAPYMDFACKIITSLIILSILTFFVKKSENHIARGFILTLFVILFYNVGKFTIFAILVFITLIVSALYLKINRSFIFRGLFLGIISSIAGHYLAGILMNL